MAQEPISTQVLDRILERCGRDGSATIPILQAIQAEAGYVPVEAMKYVAAHTDIDATRLYGVATFYTQFRLKPVGRTMIRVCHGTACHVAGAERITAAVRDALGLADEDDTTSDQRFTVDEVACLGCCSLAPVIMVGETTHGKLTPDKVRKVIAGYRDTGAAAEESA